MNDLDMQELMKIYEQGYGFYWKGKGQAVKDAENNESEHIDYYDGNLYIEGDNLVALKRLQRDYSGRIKMIYIDPPYNTKKKFIYNDNFKKSKKDSLSEGDRLHSNWLNMMYPRLKLARNLLTDDGVIFISIDDNEQENLKKICNEIFGEENFIGNIIWQSRTSISNDYHISNNHNHTFVYSKFANKLRFGGEYLDQTEYINPDSDERGPWKLVPIDANHVGGDTVYGIINPKTGVEYFPPNGRIWAYNKRKFQELLEEGRIKFGINDDSSPKKKLYLNERIKNGDRKTPSSILLDGGSTKDGTTEIMSLFSNKKLFDYPKPKELVIKLLKYSSKDNSGLILDFFSGSATTAHAVMQLNAEDGGNRKYIMVQLPEICDEKSEAYKAGYKNICEIGKERIRRAGEKIKADETLPAENREKLDIGFKVITL